jgi:hypothetical protein
MIALQEITSWPGTTPNHIYIFDDAKNKIYGYVVKDELRLLPKGINIDRSGRKFKEIPNAWSVNFPEEKG